MQNHKAFVLAGLLLLLAAVIMDYAVPRLEIAHSRLLPIATFPRKFGAWQAGEDIPVDPELHEKLPHAKIIQRTYTDPAGQEVQLLLLTSSDRTDFHDPSGCFPSQGWNLIHRKQFTLNGQPVNTMSAEHDGQTVDVFYWLIEDRVADRPHGPFLKKIYALRGKIAKEEGELLLVRLITPHSEQSQEALLAFTRQLHAPLQSLTAARGPAA